MRHLLLCVLALCVTATVIAQPYDPSLLGGLKWRLIGPFRGGRALAVAGVPGNAEKFYFGAVGGGGWVWENAGRAWTPIFDLQSVACIGRLALRLSHPYR